MRLPSTAQTTRLTWKNTFSPTVGASWAAVVGREAELGRGPRRVEVPWKELLA
jgi:hypothetical protein